MENLLSEELTLPFLPKFSVEHQYCLDLSHQKFSLAFMSSNCKEKAQNNALTNMDIINIFMVTDDSQKNSRNILHLAPKN